MSRIEGTSALGLTTQRPLRALSLYILNMLNYVFLILAIVAEAAGTTLLKMPDLGAIIGLVLIVSGVAVLNLFSKMDIH